MLCCCPASTLACVGNTSIRKWSAVRNDASCRTITTRIRVSNLIDICSSERSPVTPLWPQERNPSKSGRNHPSRRRLTSSAIWKPSASYNLRRGNRVAAASALPYAIQAVSEIAEAESLGAATVVVTAVLATAVATGILRATAYSQMEYITAAMISRYTPKGQSADVKVIQMGGGTRELFYYPKSTGLVNFVDENANPSLMQQAGVQASIGVMGRKQRATSLSFAPSSSQDAVVSLKILSKLTAEQRASCLEEVARALKPGAPFIFIEPIEEGASLLRQISGGSSQALSNQALDELKGVSSFRDVQWDVALEVQDPHAVGVAFKRDESDLDRIAISQKKRQSKAASKNQSAGFGAGAT